MNTPDTPSDNADSQEAVTRNAQLKALFTRDTSLVESERARIVEKLSTDPVWQQAVSDLLFSGEVNPFEFLRKP